MAPKKRRGGFNVVPLVPRGQKRQRSLEESPAPKVPINWVSKIDYAAIQSQIADGSLLGWPQIWPGGSHEWMITLTAQQRGRIYKALDERISRGEILLQPNTKNKWTWARASAELQIVKTLCQAFAELFVQEEKVKNKALNDEMQRQENEARHKNDMMLAKEDAQNLHAAWALRHKKMLQALGADLQWCERQVRPTSNFATDGFSRLKRVKRLETSTEIFTKTIPQVDSPDDGEYFFNQPEQIVLPLRSYQLEGVRWLAKAQVEGTSVILGDEMGLGKTLQTIAYLAHLKFDRSVDGPHLILCPLSVIDHWREEFARCCPAMRVVVVAADDRHANDKLFATYPQDVDVVVTTYGCVHSVWCRGFFVDAWWRVLVLDEGHCIKNPNSELAKFLRRLNRVQALILTGTPLQNDLVELWALLNFLYPELFPRQNVFRAAFRIDQSSITKNGKKPMADAQSLRQVHDFLKVCMLRRMKSTVEVDVPPKVETKIMCPLSHAQRWYYAQLLLGNTGLFAEVRDAAKIDGAAPVKGRTLYAWRKLQFLLMQLRKVCNHPYLLPATDPNGAKNIEESLLREPDEQFVEASGKLKVLDRLLHRLLASGHRCTVFSQFTQTLNIIEKMLALRGLKFCRLDGSTARDQRGTIIKNFNSAEAQVDIFLLSTRAGGLGINLQTADTCILFDSDWNPQMDIQAMARVHRIGQKRHVHVYRLVTEGTVEERIVNRAQKKLCLDRIVNHNSVVSTDVHRNVEEWIEDVQLESSAVVGSDVSKSLSDQELDAIIDRSRQLVTSVNGIIDGGTTHSGADVMEGRVAVEKNSEEHMREVAKRMKATTAASMTGLPPTK